jgi:5-methylcytosine-specific restriction protein A
MAQTFSQFCTEIGLPLKNERWSWCAINDERRQAVFTVWEDRLDLPNRDRIDFSWLADPERTENGAREFRRVILKVIDGNYDAYGILCQAADVDARPRKRKRFEKELLVLNITLEDERFIARILGRTPASAVGQTQSVVDAMFKSQSAIDDLDVELLGETSPVKKAFLGAFFLRDDKVRSKVIARSKGRCEYCGQVGFRKLNGQFYVETHHIVSLAKQGPDTLDNVIALCPGHHRQAHYGADWEDLEAQFKIKLAKIRGR